MLAADLQSRGMIVAISEDPGFEVRGDRSAAEECFANIRDSNHYVLVIGFSRGAEFENEPGISITRQEFREALKSLKAQGAPVIRAFVLKGALDAADGGSERFAKAGGDDYEHFRSFVDEVERSNSPDEPSFLTRVANGAEIASAVNGWLNLGRNFQETLLRHSLERELAANLTTMVSRLGRSVFPEHWRLRDVRDEFPVSVDTWMEDASRVWLDYRLGSKLASFVIGRAVGDRLSTRVMTRAFDEGLFLEFDSVGGRLVGTAAHRVLGELIADVDRLRTIDSTDWSTPLLGELGVNVQRRQDTFHVDGRNLIWALGSYDRAVDVFDGHVALMRGLHGVLPMENISFTRRPSTPLGREQEKGIEAESVSADEVSLLFGQNAFPFGSRMVPSEDAAGKRDQINRIREGLKKSVADLGMDEGLFDGMDDDFFESFLLADHEGIEPKEYPRRR